MVVERWRGGLQPEVYRSDLPADFAPGKFLAIDTETMGLNLFRDRLCVVQVKSQDGRIAVIQIQPGQAKAPNLARILTNNAVVKIFHFARADMAILLKAFDIRVYPVYCTKIASKLTRTNSDQHGLKTLTQELTGKEVSKDEQSSDWAVPELSQAQIRYAASDVENLHEIMAKLNERLDREGRTDLAHRCFDALPVLVDLDVRGWTGNIFAH